MGMNFLVWSILLSNPILANFIPKMYSLKLNRIGLALRVVKAIYVCLIHAFLLYYSVLITHIDGQHGHVVHMSLSWLVLDLSNLGLA